MEKALKIYAEVLRLVRRLSKDSKPYYANYARKNFVNYREVEANDDQALHELFLKAYNHLGPQQAMSQGKEMLL
ncbi:LYR motif-containing protein [Pyrus ussuriensis x Pyrus communis]|uniref:LYR motif-containing protein n=1 Tax=Pyrus ussuriensis x Pyrus communis TaxID=2448454 RepID=A0A5N5FNL5_9ROSA|nr:LYR motif-containing protein [Pyrus ussuriensis x Pyrus communis]